MINNFKNQFDENEKLIHQCEAKIHELKLGDLKEKVGRVSLMGTLYYLPVLLLSFLLNVPGPILPLVTLIGSFGLGAITNAHLERKAKCKSRFKKVSKSKNESERLEEVFRLEMEIERLKCHNQTLQNVVNRISKEDEMHRNFARSGRYILYDKRDELGKKELIKKISFLEKELQSKLTELDSLVDESTIRSKKRISTDKLDVIFHSMVYSTVPMMLSVLPVMTYMIKPLPSPSMIPMFTALGSGLATLCGSYFYLNKNKKDQLKAINRIDNERQKDDRINIEHQINKLKSAINNIYFSLYDYKKKLAVIERSEQDKLAQTKLIEHSPEFIDSLDDDLKLTLK